MAQLGTTIDPNVIEPSQFDDLPVGEHVAQIVESSVEPTKNGKGTILKLTWQVTEGQYENRKFWQNINYQHESDQAQTIGQQQIKAICDAVGYTQHLEDSDVLHFQPCRVRLGMGKANGQYAARPEVKGVKPFHTQPPAGKAAPQQQPVQHNTVSAPPKQQAAPQKAATAGPAGTRPWGNRAA